MGWFAYLHTNNKLQIKRYFSKAQIENVLESPFVKYLFNVIKAKDRDKAELKFTKMLNDLYKKGSLKWKEKNKIA